MVHKKLSLCIADTCMLWTWETPSVLTLPAYLKDSQEIMAILDRSRFYEDWPRHGWIRNAQTGAWERSLSDRNRKGRCSLGSNVECMANCPG